MTDYANLSKEKIKDALTSVVSKHDVQGLAQFGQQVKQMASQPEAKQQVLNEGMLAFNSAGITLATSDDVKAEHLTFLINGSDAIVKGTVEAARTSGSAKLALGLAQVRAREVLSTAYEMAGQYAQAAQVLAEMPVDEGLPSFEEEYKFSLWVMIAELKLKCGQEVQAENYLNTARPLERHKSIQQGTRDRFNLCYAQVLDSNKKFVEGANRYFLVAGNVAEKDALEAMRRACVAATLAEPSEARSRVLGALYMDERRPKLGDVGLVIEKLFHNRVLRKPDIEALKPLLLSQHQAKSADGETTSFDLAIIRHNILAAAKIYTSITFTDLAELLGTSAEAAEATLQQMAAQGRISAKMDQLQGRVSFVGNKTVPIQRWDNQIDTVGNLIAQVAENIVKRYPQLEPKGGI